VPNNNSDGFKPFSLYPLFSKVKCFQEYTQWKVIYMNQRAITYIQEDKKNNNHSCKLKKPMNFILQQPISQQFLFQTISYERKIGRENFHTHYQPTRATTTSFNNKITCKRCSKVGEYLPCPVVDLYQLSGPRRLQQRTRGWFLKLSCNSLYTVKNQNEMTRTLSQQRW
jgi:hypothetical protein